MRRLVSATLLCCLTAACAGAPPLEEPARTPEIREDLSNLDGGLRDAAPSEVEPEVVLPESLEIEITGAEELSVMEFLMRGDKRGSGILILEGAVKVRIANPSELPVKLVHMDPANLVFTRLEQRSF